MRLLVVEDDAPLARGLKTDMEKAGFAVDVADNGEDGEYMGEMAPYDCVVLDLGLPKRSGLDVLKNWRKKGARLPVIVLTARGAWYERVEGFKAGADDYLGKPFHIEELIARVNALIRRSRDHNTGGEISARGLALDEEKQSVTTADGRTLELTGMEFRLLRYFMLHPGAVLSKNALADHVYDYDSEKDSNVIEVYVKRLREKIGRDLIHTKRGQGYVFGD